MPAARAPAGALMALGLLATVSAQSYGDFTLVRNRPPEFASVLEFRAGVSGGMADDENEPLGFTDEIGLDGHVWYHNGQLTSGGVILDAYAGRDGAYLAVKENQPGGNASRIELTGRYFAFGREGFYRDGEFIPTGRYDVDDYGAYVAFGRGAAEGLHLEAGPYVKWMQFGRNDDTDPAYVPPDDHRVFGVRTVAEHNTLMLDRGSGRPLDGFIMTLSFEAEQNNSDATFGTPVYMSSLPSQLWRLRGAFEWYVPQGDLGVWKVRIDGKYADRDDRVSNFDAQEPIGYLWFDGDLGLRIDISSLAITPFASGQWINTVSEDGVGSDSEFFFGGGGRVDFDIGDALSLYGEYSYLQNPARAPISASIDTLGEHQFFVGLEFRIGAQRM